MPRTHSIKDIAPSGSKFVRELISAQIKKKNDDRTYIIIMESQLTSLLIRSKIRYMSCLGIYKGLSDFSSDEDKPKADFAIVSSSLKDGTPQKLLEAIKDRQFKTRCLVFVADKDIDGIYTDYNGVVADQDLGKADQAGVKGALACINGSFYESSSIRTGKDLKPIKGDELTERERGILELLKLKMTNKEISRSEGLSEETVKKYAKNVLNKLGLRSRHELS